MIIFGLDLYKYFLQTDIKLIFELFIILFAIILILQTSELINLSSYFIKSNEDSSELKNTKLIWDYDLIKKQYSNFNPIVRKIIDFFLIDKNFKKLLYINILLSILLIINSIIIFLPINFILILLLIVIQLLISNRFGGSFNGAADSMVLIILISLLLFELDEVTNLFSIPIENNINQKLSFIYLTFNVSNSYFSAGWAKLKEKNWLNGIALSIFLEESVIKSKFKDKVIEILSVNIVSRLIGISIILWEISIIIALFIPNYLIIYLIFGVIFHFCNYLLFGLNRFFLLWIITYPILIYTSIHYLSTLGMCLVN